MKIKSLLVAGMAAIAFAGMAAENDVVIHNSMVSFSDDFTIKAGETKEVIVTLNRQDPNDVLEDGTDNNGFNSWTLYFTVPEGLHMTYAELTDDTMVPNARGKLFQPFSEPAYDTIEDEVRLIVTDMTQTPCTKTPVEILLLEFQADENFKGGDIMLTNLNYMKPDNTKNIIDPEKLGTEAMIIKNFPTEGPDDAVANINAGKAVAGVKYYNVAGVAADEAFDGVNIVVTTYADGTQNIVKVVK